MAIDGFSLSLPVYEIVMGVRHLNSTYCEAPDISLGPISHMFAYRLFSSMSYPNLLNAFLYS